MRKCTLGVGKVKALVKAFLREVNTMKALRVKYYLFIKKKGTITSIHSLLYTLAHVSLHHQSLHSVHSLPSKPTLKPSLSLHSPFTFGGF